MKGAGAGGACGGSADGPLGSIACAGGVSPGSGGTGRGLLGGAESPAFCVYQAGGA
ncbi:hypothetical protein ACGFZL_18765 [Streptomyces sp. NPDC048182]|uniref:hypothetical protein n=1 Tax=Streptomyces sp. NPDC048182 TaxID=3365507 RepID=UPI003722A17C